MSSTTAADDTRVLLVTGANKGIGYETAKLLAQQLPAATILLGTRSLDNGDAAVQRMKQESAVDAASFANVHPIAIDVTDSASVQKAVERVRSEHGRLDVLIHNSGISNIAGDGMDAAVLDVNIDGARAAVEAFTPLIPPASGLIILVSSEVGSYGAHGLSPELRQLLVEQPEQLTWPQLQALRSDWEAYAKEQPSQYVWQPRDAIAGHYTVSKTLVNAYLRMRAAQQPQPRLVAVCPGFCATDLNNHRGTDTPARGAQSVTWPLFHQAETQHGVLYKHGNVLPWVQPVPEFYAANVKRMVAEMAAKKAQKQ